MPYLIEKSDGSRVPADLTPDEARFKAQQFRVLEVDAGGAVIGDVSSDEPVFSDDVVVEEPAAEGPDAVDIEPAEPAPARKSTTRTKK